MDINRNRGTGNRNPGNSNSGNRNPGNRNPLRRTTFTSVRGTIVELTPSRAGGRRNDPCTIFATVEDMDGNIVTFVITPSTFVVDYTTLSVGMRCTFWYRTDAPVPLIYPPQYTAVVVAQERNERFVDVSFYNSSLINEEQTLRLNIDNSVDIRTTNNQFFQGNPANNELVVTYVTSTRSIPAQTTPRRIVVLC